MLSKTIYFTFQAPNISDNVYTKL